MAEMTRRDMLVKAAGMTAGAAAFAFLPAAGACAAAARPVNEFRQSGDTDDTAAFARAVAAGPDVHVPGGRGLGPGGAYIVGEVALRPGTRIFGDGAGRSLIRGAPGANAVFFCDSGAPGASIGGIRIADLAIEGLAGERGFAEHNHLVNLAGAADAAIERVAFRAFQGDALILSSGRRLGLERHNRGVTVRDCTFDGVNRENRNAISVIDGDGVLIEGCAFRNCTRADMPGAIDLEPDESPFAIIRNVTIRNCRFDAIGGNLGIISLQIPAAVRALPTGIVIERNQMNGYAGTGAAVSLNVNRRLPADAPAMGIRITGNRGASGNLVYAFYSARGVHAEDNEWSDYAQGAWLGYVEDRHLLRDARIADRFVRCGTRSKVGMYVFNVSGLDLGGSTFVDCGDGSANAYAISFARGTSDHVSLENVTVTSPTGRTRRAVVEEAGHRFDRATNRQGGNRFGTLAAATITR